MTKFRKNVIGAIMCLVMLLVGVCAFTACGSKDLSVTFTVEGKTQTVDVVNGKVTMPADPEKEFYEFRGWYTTSTFDEGSEFTKDTEVKENLTVYAYFAPVHVGISVNGEAATDIKLEELAGKTTEYTEDATSKNLTFDGWYIDAAYGTKYNTQDADNLYARYCATVTFDNGYETLKSVQVGINSTMKAPDKEYEDFVPYYMDKEDLSYVDENGNAVDFSSLVITKNTAIKVMWKSPYLAYQKIEGTANDYAVVGFDYKSSNSEEFQNIKRFPAISFLSKNVTIDGVKDCNVVTADFSVSAGMYTATVDQCDSAVYAYFADGIQYINRFQACTKLETVKLPASLKVLEKSFWNMRNLKSLELPEGLEIIIDSLWGDYMEGMVGYYRGVSAFPFTVNIPASVNTLVTVPSNLKFAEGSEYYYEEGELFRNRTVGGVTYKTLVCTYQDKVANETLTVAEGAEAVSVGAFKGLTVKYISLPSTFKKISYTSDENNATYELSYYTGSMLTDMQRVQAPDEKSAIDSYSVFSGLTSNDFGYVYLNVASMPEGISEYAFTQGKTPYTELTESDGTTLEKVVCIGAVKKRKAVIIHIVGEDTRDSSTKRTYSITGKKSAGTLTIDEILNAIGINDGSYSYEITELGKPYTPGTLDHNLYLRVTYTRNILGVTYTKDDATKTITVTGFDKDTAFDLGGVYRICISFDDEALKTYKVVIADNAFKDNNYISEVYVGSQVVSIGEKAFANTSNLTKFIVSDGGLEEIKTRAFENAGCVVNGETITVNENIKKNGIKFVLPLAKMKNIEPYAFKTKGIFVFTATESEGNEDNPRKLTAAAKAGEYFFVESMSGDYYGIMQYVKNTDTKTMKDNVGNDDLITIYDVRYVATAGGFNDASGHMGIGYSLRGKAYEWGAWSEDFAAKQHYVYRYEVMEGSVYYLGNAFNYISFGIFSKIHKNAFTDMEETHYAIYNNCTFDIWMDADKVKNQDSSLFEEGWFNGRANSENTFMSRLQDHEDFYL